MDHVLRTISFSKISTSFFLKVAQAIPEDQLLNYSKLRKYRNQFSQKIFKLIKNNTKK